MSRDTAPSPAKTCPACMGCGKIANDDDRSPWTYWERLRPPANIAVQLGIVVPLRCEECGGTGNV
jgi:hypothetical protein